MEAKIFLTEGNDDNEGGPPLHFLGFRPGFCFLLSTLPLRAGVIVLDRNSLFWSRTVMRVDRFSLCPLHFAQECRQSTGQVHVL